MAAARKYEALTDGSEALIIQFVNKPSEEAALKAFNEVARQNALSSIELKNIAIDEIRKELKELATKDELYATKNELKAEIKALDNKIDGVEKTLKAEIKSVDTKFKYLITISVAILIMLIKALFF